MPSTYPSNTRREFLCRSISALAFFGLWEFCGKDLFSLPREGFALIAADSIQEIEKGLLAGMRKNYYQALDQRLAKTFRGETVHIVDAIKKRDRSLIDENQSWIVDPPAEFHLLMTSVVLATYQVLLEEVKSRDTVLDITRFAFFEAQQHNKARTQFIKMVEENPDPYEMLVKISKYKEEKQYGKTFSFERERDDENFYFLNVHKCFYHDFFVAHGASELTPVFCDWDNVWGDALKDGRFGVKFERPETIGYGGSVCRFQFTRTERQSRNLSLSLTVG